MTAAEHKTSLHGALFLLSIAFTLWAIPPLHWPWSLILPLLMYVAVVLAIPPLRRTFPPITSGQLGGFSLLLAIVITTGTCATLVIYHFSMNPDVHEVAAVFKGIPISNRLAAGASFCLLNAFLEEFIFRGLLWSAIASEWNKPIALLTTSVLFGLAHYHGYPPGPLGAALATLFGLLLGYLRNRAEGLALPILCHICADATIFVLVTAFPFQTQ